MSLSLILLLLPLPVLRLLLLLLLHLRCRRRPATTTISPTVTPVLFLMPVASRFILSSALALSAHTRVAPTLRHVSVRDDARTPCTSPSLTAPSLIWRMRYSRQQAAQARTLSTAQPCSSCCRVFATQTSRQQFCSATRVFKGQAGSCALAQRTASTRGAACCTTCSRRQA
jgi:hypothetical protein